MNRFKKALAIALSAALMVPSTAFAATSSPVKTVINGKKAEQPVVKMDKKVEKKLAKGFKATNLKKKSKTIDLGVKGKKAKKWLKVTKDGKVTLKKGIKKGVYKVRVKAKKGTKSYKKGTVVIKIVVK